MARSRETVRAFQTPQYPQLCGCDASCYQLNIAAGIVVGRLQHDGVLEQTECNHLKKRVNFPTLGDEE
jgi:hypothetical protein